MLDRSTGLGQGGRLGDCDVVSGHAPNLFLHRWRPTHSSAFNSLPLVRDHKVSVWVTVGNLQQRAASGGIAGLPGPHDSSRGVDMPRLRAPPLPQQRLLGKHTGPKLRHPSRLWAAPAPSPVPAAANEGDNFALDFPDFLLMRISTNNPK